MRSYSLFISSTQASTVTIIKTRFFRITSQFRTSASSMCVFARELTGALSIAPTIRFIYEDSSLVYKNFFWCLCSNNNRVKASWCTERCQTRNFSNNWFTLFYWVKLYSLKLIILEPLVINLCFMSRILNEITKEQRNFHAQSILKREGKTSAWSPVVETINP